jgi:hypothetical protein
VNIYGNGSIQLYTRIIVKFAFQVFTKFLLCDFCEKVKIYQIFIIKISLNNNFYIFILLILFDFFLFLQLILFIVFVLFDENRNKFVFFLKLKSDL